MKIKYVEIKTTKDEQIKFNDARCICFGKTNYDPKDVWAEDMVEIDGPCGLVRFKLTEVKDVDFFIMDEKEGIKVHIVSDSLQKKGKNNGKI